MKLQFGIQPGKTKSNVESFIGHKSLSFQPFESGISGLTLYLKGTYGIIAQIPIENTEKPFNIPLIPYEYCWFEYTLTDQTYLIDILVD